MCPWCSPPLADRTHVNTPERVVVSTTGGSYPVLVGDGVSGDVADLAGESAPGGRVGLITDTNVGPLHAERIAEACRRRGLNVLVQTFPAGESSKTRRWWSDLTDGLLNFGLGRDGCIVAVGGGVTTDLAGFVAATYQRGVPVIQVPTSYLAMIDASVGGKTGVDVEAGKNLVGAFHPPVAVLADTSVLRTLPGPDRREGLVEAVKHGAILDEAHLSAIERSVEDLLAADPAVAAGVVADSVRLKAGVVEKDEREGGYRQILNFGHTVGHAVEAASGYRVGHGRAVAVGMLAEVEIGEEMGITEPGTGRRLASVLGRLVSTGSSSPDGPSRAPQSAPGAAEAVGGVDEAAAFLLRDKKVRGGRPRYVLLAEVGQVAPGEGWTHEVPDDIAREALRRAMERC